MFIPRTPDGTLLSTFRKVEQELESACTRGYKRITMIERGGDKLKDLLYMYGSREP